MFLVPSFGVYSSISPFFFTICVCAFELVGIVTVPILEIVVLLVCVLNTFSMLVLVGMDASNTNCFT